MTIDFASIVPLIFRQDRIENILKVLFISISSFLKLLISADWAYAGTSRSEIQGGFIALLLLVRPSHNSYGCFDQLRCAGPNKLQIKLHAVKNWMQVKTGD